MANSAPIAGSPTLTVSSTSGIQNFNLLAGAVDPDGDAIFYQGGFSLTLSDANAAVLAALTPAFDAVLGNGGVFTFDPALFAYVPVGATRTLQLEFQISDGLSGVVGDIAVININGVNDAPGAAVLTASPIAEGGGNRVRRLERSTALGRAPVLRFCAVCAQACAASRGCRPAAEQHGQRQGVDREGIPDQGS